MIGLLFLEKALTMVLFHHRQGFSQVSVLLVSVHLKNGAVIIQTYAIMLQTMQKVDISFYGAAIVL